MPNLDPVHDDDRSAADPDFTITEDDRAAQWRVRIEERLDEIKAQQKALHDTIIRSLEGMTSSFVNLGKVIDSAAAAMAPLMSTANELADGAGLAPVDAPDERTCAQKMADGDFGEAVFAMYKIIRDNIGGEWHTEVDVNKATARSALALCTMYRSGAATTGGSDHNLRDDLRAILRAEGFDVRC